MAKTSEVDSNGVPAMNQDDQILAQKAAIEEEIRQRCKLVGDMEDLSAVENEFANDPIYLEKVKNLKSKYGGIRRMRPDGNCFYRAMAFGYFEKIAKDSERFQRFKSALVPSKDLMVKLGFPAFTVEDFYDFFMEQLESVSPSRESKEEATDLCRVFNDQGTSDYLVVFLRLLTSMHLKNDADFYQNFMEGDVSVADFCGKEVELMYHESDHIHITALCKEAGIKVRILYLDRGSNKEASPHDFPEDCDNPDVHLLYRPGHYDILYSKKV